MIRNKTLHTAARVLLGAFIAAYAMSSVHVYARAAQGEKPAPVAATQHAMPLQAAADAGADADAPDHQMEMESHCQAKVVDPSIMLCKFHCQNAVQTLDYPSATLADLPPASALTVALVDVTILRKPLVDKAFRPETAHHGGAPPRYASTARLRI